MQRQKEWFDMRALMFVFDRLTLAYSVGVGGIMAHVQGCRGERTPRVQHAPTARTQREG